VSFRLFQPIHLLSLVVDVDQAYKYSVTLSDNKVAIVKLTVKYFHFLSVAFLVVSFHAQ